MARCNELCTKDATSHCAVCEALAERDRFERFWFKGEVFVKGIRPLRQWWCPSPCSSASKAFYTRLRAAGKPEKVARCAAARKLLHIAWAVVTKTQDFDPHYAQTMQRA